MPGSPASSTTPPEPPRAASRSAVRAASSASRPTNSVVTRTASPGPTLLTTTPRTARTGRGRLASGSHRAGGPSAIRLYYCQDGSIRGEVRKYQTCPDHADTAPCAAALSAERRQPETWCRSATVPDRQSANSDVLWNRRHPTFPLVSGLYGVPRRNRTGDPILTIDAPGKDLAWPPSGTSVGAIVRQPRPRATHPWCSAVIRRFRVERRTSCEASFGLGDRSRQSVGARGQCAYVADECVALVRPEGGQLWRPWDGSESTATT
jgi:hypothetical protein